MSGRIPIPIEQVELTGGVRQMSLPDDYHAVNSVDELGLRQEAMQAQDVNDLGLPGISVPIEDERPELSTDQSVQSHISVETTERKPIADPKIPPTGKSPAPSYQPEIVNEDARSIKQTSDSITTGKPRDPIRQGVTETPRLPEPKPPADFDNPDNSRQGRQDTDVPVAVSYSSRHVTTKDLLEDTPPEPAPLPEITVSEKSQFTPPARAEGSSTLPPEAPDIQDPEIKRLPPVAPPQVAAASKPKSPSAVTTKSMPESPRHAEPEVEGIRALSEDTKTTPRPIAVIADAATTNQSVATKAETYPDQEVPSAVRIPRPSPPEINPTRNRNDDIGQPTSESASPRLQLPVSVQNETIQFSEQSPPLTSHQVSQDDLMPEIPVPVSRRRQPGPETETKASANDKPDAPQTPQVPGSTPSPAKQLPTLKTIALPPPELPRITADGGPYIEPDLQEPKNKSGTRSGMPARTRNTPEDGGPPVVAAAPRATESSPSAVAMRPLDAPPSVSSAAAPLPPDAPQAPQSPIAHDAPPPVSPAPTHRSLDAPRLPPSPIAHDAPPPASSTTPQTNPEAPPAVVPRAPDALPPTPAAASLETVQQEISQAISPESSLPAPEPPAMEKASSRGSGPVLLVHPNYNIPLHALNDPRKREHPTSAQQWPMRHARKQSAPSESPETSSPSKAFYEPPPQTPTSVPGSLEPNPVPMDRGSRVTEPTLQTPQDRAAKQGPEIEKQSIGQPPADDGDWQQKYRQAQRQSTERLYRDAEKKFNFPPQEKVVDLPNSDPFQPQNKEFGAQQVDNLAKAQSSFDFQAERLLTAHTRMIIQLAARIEELEKLIEMEEWT